jgi:FtsH-binding integral membrane protein
LHEPSAFSRPTHASPTDAAPASTATLMGQVLFLVAVAIAFAAAGTFIGRELTRGASLGCFFAGFGMLLVSSFGGNRFPIFRVGGFAIGWLYAIALLIGLGMGPAVAYVATVEPSALTQAAGGTALTVLGMGALGFALSKDLAPWMRPLSIAILGLVVVSIVMTLFFGGGNPIISLAIYGVSALLIMVDFNFLRKHGTEDHAVILATGIFVSIVNIFLSLMNLFSGR